MTGNAESNIKSNGKGSVQGGKNMLDFLKSILFGKNQNDIMIIIFLEWMLAIYGIGMTVASKRLWAKIINLILTVLWVVCAILNMVYNL